MKQFLSDHNKCFKAEWLKLRHSGMFWLLLCAAAFIPILTTTVSIFVDTGSNVETNKWDRFIETNFGAFTSFFFPLFVVLMTVRIVYLEHRSDTWKLLETQPVSRFALFFSKWEVAAIISLLCLFGLLLFSVIGGFVLQISKPDYNLSSFSIDWSKTATVLLRFWIASLGIISIQYFFGLLIKSFAWPMSIGLIGIIAGSIFAGFGYFNWFPYSATSFTTASYNGSANGQFLIHHEKLSLLWSALFLWLGYRLFIKRQFNKAFFSPAKQLLVFVSVLIGFTLLAWWINKPTIINKYSSTVIAGNIDSKQQHSNIALLKQPLLDTIALIKTNNNHFHTVISADMEPGIYVLKSGSQSTPLFIGRNDSVYVDWKMGESRSEVTVTGTRLAENNYLRNYRSNIGRLRESAYNHTPQSFSARVSDEWRDQVANLQNFKTTDRIKLSEDFITIQKKLIAVSLLNLLDNYYPSIHSVYYPNEELKYPAFVEKLRKEVNLNDQSLASYTEYRNYIINYLKNKTSFSDGSFFTKLKDSIQQGLLLDYVAYDAAEGSFNDLRDSTRRSQVLYNALATIQSDAVKQKLVSSNNRLNNLQKGRKAYNFKAEALNGNSFSLANLNNRYVVVDVWATWCLPCKKESPIFENYAERYTNEGLAFVSLSIDEDKNAWRSEASFNKNKKVLQLWALNADTELKNEFAISSIPRFILIDTKGNIVNASLPPPSDPEFEAILLKEIPSLSNGFF
ncbi:MAG: ABC transporter permease [Flavisolibacter sp.]|nr:ABC transporter permease [Flavisolibacter sp.]